MNDNFIRPTEEPVVPGWVKKMLRNKIFWIVLVIFILFMAIIAGLVLIGVANTSLPGYPDEASHYVDYNKKVYYFNEYYINNDNEVIFDVYWTKDFLMWNKTEETIRIPLSDFIHNVK